MACELKTLRIYLMASTAGLASAVGSALAQSPPQPSPALPPQAQSGAPAVDSSILAPIVVTAPSEPAPRSARARATGTPAATAAPRRAQGAPAPVAAPASPPTALDALSTSSEKTAATIYDSTGTVTVKSSAEIDRQVVSSPRELVHDEPGVTVGNQPSRGGSTNYVIRGVGENRVRIEIDGVKVPDFPSTNSGSPTGYTRDFVDLEAMKRVEIIRGPASALYGSDSIGGVVTYVTKDPADYLALFGKDVYGSIKVGYDSLDRSIAGTYTGAVRVGQVESMAVLTRRQGHEADISSDVRTPNPVEYNSINMLGKIVYNTAGAGQIKLTGELFKKELNTNLLSQVGLFPDLAAKVYDDTSVDRNKRVRGSLEWTAPVSLWMADVVKTRLYVTQVNRDETEVQIRNTLGAPGPLPTSPTQIRTSNFGYEQGIMGAELQATAFRRFLGGEHTITYGLTADQTETTRPRDRDQLTIATGAVTKSVAGERYPNKNFPDTTTTQSAFYVQDVAQWGALRVIPAVRFDYFGLHVHPDADFANSNLRNAVVSDQSLTAISPKLGATFDLTENYRLFAQYARGFRAPPYDNANFGFVNTTSFYQILPNTNMKPETSDGYELGLRGRFASGSSFQFSGFYNTYKDFIDIVTVASPPIPALTTFQYQNIPSAVIFGYEGKGEYRFMPEWSVFGALAYAQGTNEESKRPIDSVDPWTGIAGLRYRGFSGWGGEVRAKYVAEKGRVSNLATLSPTITPIYQVPAHTTVDALLSYEVVPTFSFNIGVFNIFDNSYFNPIDVAGVTANNANLELLRAPGRTFATNATVRW